VDHGWKFVIVFHSFPETEALGCAAGPFETGAAAAFTVTVARSADGTHEDGEIAGRRLCTWRFNFPAHRVIVGRLVRLGW